MGQGRFYTPDSVIAFRRAAQVAAKNARIRPFPREQRVCVTFYWFRGRKQGDLDKRVSVVLDALAAGVWYQDDAQVAELHCWRLDDKDHPRLEVEVTAIEQVAA